MQGKKFKNLSTNRIVEIKDIFEDIIILQDNSKIKKDKILDISLFEPIEESIDEEYIDPNKFFQNSSFLNDLAKKIKQVPEEVVNRLPIKTDDEKVNFGKDNTIKPLFEESAIIHSDPEIEKMDLMRKYAINPTSMESSRRQMEHFDSFLRNDVSEDQVIRIEVNRDGDKEEFLQNNISIPSQNSIQPLQLKEENHPQDPIITMFKNVKRTKDFKISLNIENKIPRPDFIEMMEDSYNISIIEYLANEFTQEITKDPSIIKKKIIDEIRSIVFGENTKEPQQKKEEIISENKSPRRGRQRKTEENK